MRANPLTYAASPCHSFPRAQSLRHDVSLDGDIPEFLAATSPTRKSVKPVIERPKPPHIRLSAQLRLAPLATETFAGLAAPVAEPPVVSLWYNERYHDTQHPL